MVLVFALVKELAEKSGRSERPDGVPYADEPHRWARTRDLDVVKSLLPFRGSRTFAALIAVIEVGNIVVVILLNEANLVHETSESTDCECSPAEAEEIQLVAGLEVVN